MGCFRSVSQFFSMAPMPACLRASLASAENRRVGVRTKKTIEVVAGLVPDERRQMFLMHRFSNRCGTRFAAHSRQLKYNVVVSLTSHITYR